MAELASVSNVSERGAIADGFSRLVGRIQGKPRRHEGRWYTFLILPALDAYDHPQVVEVRSEERIGSEGEDVNVKVRIGGFNRKAFDHVDRVTGETRRVVPNNVTLDVI